MFLADVTKDLGDIHVLLEMQPGGKLFPLLVAPNICVGATNGSMSSCS